MPRREQVRGGSGRALALAAVATGAAVYVLERRALQRWAAVPDRRPPRPPAPDVETEVRTGDGARLRVVEWGDPGDPAVVLVHGITAALEDWLPVVPALLAAGRRVVALDLRGHGRSTLGRERVTTERLAADLAEVLEARRVSGAVVAGHSLGGYVALALAVHRPDVLAQRVTRLVLVGATPTMRRPRELAVLAVNASPLTRAAQLLPVHGTVLLRVGVYGDRPALAAVEDQRARWSRCPVRTRVAYATGLSGQSLTARLDRVRVPVTVLRGTEDRVTPASRSALLARALPEARVVELRGAGHVPPSELPDEVAAALL